MLLKNTYALDWTPLFFTTSVSPLGIANQTNVFTIDSSRHPDLPECNVNAKDPAPRQGQKKNTLALAVGKQSWRDQGTEKKS